jgi:hypothetical protein
VQEMTGLRDLMVVHSLSKLMFPTQIREDYERQIEFVEEFPLGELGIAVREPPKSDEWSMMGFDTRQVKKFRRAYGWRSEWPVVIERAGRALGGRIRIDNTENDGTWDGVFG